MNTSVQFSNDPMPRSPIKYYSNNRPNVRSGANKRLYNRQTTPPKVSAFKAPTRFITASFFCSRHPNEKVTNFCKSKDCALPLCPKCVKTHSDEHAARGVFGQFQLIDDCIKEVHSFYLQRMQYLCELADECTASESLHSSKVKEQKQILRNLKAKVIADIEVVYDRYEKEIEECALAEGRSMMLAIQDSLKTVDNAMQQCRRKFELTLNQTHQIDSLIEFYSSAENEKPQDLKLAISKGFEYQQLQLNEQILKELFTCLENHVRVQKKSSEIIVKPPPQQTPSQQIYAGKRQNSNGKQK